jgi:hypothetical protein
METKKLLLFGILYLSLIVFIFLIANSNLNSTGRIISEQVIINKEKIIPSQGRFLVNVQEDTAIKSTRLNMTTGLPYKLYTVYSLDLNLEKGDIVFLDGQVEATNDAGINAMLGTYLRANGSQLGYYTTQNVDPVMHHIPLRTNTVYRVSGNGTYKFELVAYSASDRAKKGSYLKVEEGYGHLLAMVYR